MGNMANPNKILFSFSHFPYQPNKVNLYLFFILPTNTYPVKFSQFYIPSIYYKVRIYQRESDHCHLGLIWLGVIIVEMENEGEADQAITALNGSTLDGRAINVNEARPKPDRGFAGGAGGGGGNRFGGGGGGGGRRPGGGGGGRREPRW